MILETQVTRCVGCCDVGANLAYFNIIEFPEHKFFADVCWDCLNDAEKLKEVADVLLEDVDFREEML